MIRAHCLQSRLHAIAVRSRVSSQQQRSMGVMVHNKHLQHQQSVSIENDLLKLEQRVNHITAWDPTSRLQSPTQLQQTAADARSEVLKLFASFMRTYSIEDDEPLVSSSVAAVDPTPSSSNPTTPTTTLGQKVLEELLSLKYLDLPPPEDDDGDNERTHSSNNQMDLQISHYNRMLGLCVRMAKSHMLITLDSKIGSSEIANTTLSVFRQMIRSGVKGNHNTLLAVLTVLSRCHCMDKMVWVLQQARQMGITCSTYTLNVMLNAFTCHGMLKEAFVVLRALTSNSGSLSISAFNILLKMCKVLPDKTEANAIAQAIISNLENGKFGVEPNLVTYCNLMELQIQAHNSRNFLRTWDSMRRFNRQIHEHGCVVFIKGCMVFQDIPVSIPELRSQIKANGLQETPVIKSSLLRLAVTRQDLHMTSVLLNEIGQLQTAIRHVPSWIASFKAVVALNDRAQFAKVYKRFRMVGTELNESLASSVLDAVRRLADFDTCLEWYRHMEQSGVKLTRVHYGMILRACVKWNQLDQAMQLFTEMLKAPLKPDNICFATLMDASVMSGDVARFNWLCSEFVKSQGVPDKSVFMSVRAASTVLTGVESNPLIRQLEMHRLVRLNRDHDRPQQSEALNQQHHNPPTPSLDNRNVPPLVEQGKWYQSSLGPHNQKPTDKAV